MPIHSHEISNLFRTIHGYGDSDPRFIFLGMEERCDNPQQELETRLRLHAQVGGLSDVADYHKKLDQQVGTAMHDHRFVRGSLQSTWQGLIRFHLNAISDNPPNVEDVRNAQRSTWGRPGSGTALVEYSPIASPGKRQWDTTAFSSEALAEYPWLRTRKEFQAYLQVLVQKYQHPLQTWLNGLHQGPGRRVIVAYGKEYWDVYRRLLGGDWREWDGSAGALPVQVMEGRSTLALLVYGPTTPGWTNAHWDALGQWVRRRLE